MRLLTVFTLLFISILGFSFAGCESDDATNPAPLNPGRLDVSVTGYEFGAVEVGDSSLFTFYIANRGERVLNLTSIDIANSVFHAYYAVDSMSVIAAESLAVRVVFRPETAGVFESQALIRSDDEERPEVSVTLRGVGLRPPVTLLEPWLVAANYADGAGNLSLLGLNSHSLRLGVIGLGNNPNDIVRDGNFLYVVNSVSHDMNVLEILDDFSIIMSEVVDLGRETNASPEFAAMDENHLLYVTNMNLGNVTIYDTRRREMLEPIPVGLSPMDILISEDKAYVCNSGFRVSDFGYDPGTVSVINLADRSTTVVNVPLNPQYLALDKRGKIHVVCTGNYVDVPGSIAVVNPTSGAVERLIAIGGKPSQLAFTPDNTGCVPAYGEWGEQNPGLVFRYNADTGEILNGPDNPILVGNGAARITVGSDGAVYIACFGADRVDKLVGADLVESIQIGDGPTPLLLAEP